ncbi:MAG: tRNA preQ1(34) S-adenosylmethionine ribosyltransferase-isomerase QueA [Bacteriovoracia bacterium]
MSAPNPFDLDAYDFTLPDELIAQRPAQPRDASRLLVVDRARGSWEHRTFRDLPEYFDARDLLVANNSRVLRARLLGRRVLMEKGREREGGEIEFLMLESRGERTWEGMFRSSARQQPGLRFRIPSPAGFITGELVKADLSAGTVVARFDQDPVDAGAGMLPLPPYIQAGDAADEVDYQTVYAKTLGSAAAPTAGLHFTPAVLAGLAARGAEWAEVTLHVGVGTFRPVKTADIREHYMHEEAFEISPSVAEAVNRRKRAGGEAGRVTAVGTTSVRTLESAWNASAIRSGAGRTSIFFHPDGLPFRVVDRLLTNFHLPKSSLLMLVSAFAGRDLILSAYAEAIRQRYRFFSYGDAMLIL